MDAQIYLIEEMLCQGGATGAMAGAAAGAAIGSVIPGIGTLIGGIIGSLGGGSAVGMIRDRYECRSCKKTFD